MLRANMLRIMIELDEAGLNEGLVRSLLGNYGGQRRALLGLLQDESLHGAYPSTEDGRLTIRAARIAQTPR
jgi:hypothetical protein